MEGGDNNGAQSSRWTCEACGCNTNQASDRTCSICGTSSGSSLLRRGGSASYAARAGWLARNLGARRMMGEELDEDDLWESVVQGDMESFALEMGGRNRLVENSRQRFLEAARAFSQANRELPAQNVDPDHVLRLATLNASSFQPFWAKPSSLIGARHRAGNGIEVGEGLERRNLAHLPLGSGEGRAIRAEEPIPRNDVAPGMNPFTSLRMQAVQAANNSIEAALGGRRSCFGFRVAFDHPTSGDVVGANMGGCYLVGVTTSSFTSYSEQNSLQQSSYFWGIEDGGQKYEGPRHSAASRNSRRSGSSSAFGIDLGNTDSLLNSHGVLFGSREVVTCVCDLDARTLTFWRDDILLGNLVTNLPRSGNLYPVAVPFNCGSTVAITGLDNDPLPLIRTFASDWRRKQEEKDDKIRKKLGKERAVLIQNAAPTPKLRRTLFEIFCMYKESNDFSKEENDVKLSQTMATRLWYRCGLKLSHLESILSSKIEKYPTLNFEDFMTMVGKVIEEDEDAFNDSLYAIDMDISLSPFEVGDKVELIEGCETYGDAASGPLQIGDRGVVLEIQRGPNGEKRSVRVLHNGRRWWYQPQAIRSERSGLIETPGVWFLHGLLRSHGYDYVKLESVVGKSVTPSSWRIGDFVTSKKSLNKNEGDGFISSPSSDGVLGRIVAETPGSSPTSTGSHGRDSGNVLVEFIDRSFADAVGIRATGLSADSVSTTETRRIRTTKLSHAFMLHDSSPNEKIDNVLEVNDIEMEDSKLCPLNFCENDSKRTSSVSEKVRSDIESLSCLEKSAIEAVMKECRRNSESLASLFSSGLPDAILSAVSVAERQMNSLEPREDLADKLVAIGALINLITVQLYGDSSPFTVRIDEMETESAASNHHEPEPEVASRNRAVQALTARRYPGRESRSDRNRGGRSQRLVASLQERRNMLLSLMSRASGRENASDFLNEIAEAGVDPTGRDFGQPPLAPLRGVPPFVFGRSGENPVLWDGDEAESALSHNRERSNQDDAPMNDAVVENVLDDDDDDDDDDSQNDEKESYLDTVLRCRGDVLLLSTQMSGSLKQGGAAYTFFVRRLISSGILLDSIAWTKALVETHGKKIQVSSSQRSAAILRGVSDEEGTPLLLLAISMGCCSKMVESLIGWGASVGVDEIRKAAKTNQPKILSLLLQHCSFSDGVVDAEKCSPEIQKVLAETKTRQGELDRQMRDMAGSFMISLLQKLLKLGLSSRRTFNPRFDLCSKAICEMLVGNVLLRALQKAQKSVKTKTQQGQDVERDCSERSDRFTVEEVPNDSGIAVIGLLGSLPRAVLGDSVLRDCRHFTTFLLLAEDFLCSKQMSDIAAGLTFLSTLLTNFPQLKDCDEMKRFGMADFVSSHSTLASNRIADILSKQLTMGLDVSASPGGSKDHKESSEAICKDADGVVVLCPKNHTAVLHITRHSSFRCDLCGNGVDRGRPMHGCRQCDWDACEDCTDKSESGLVKCTALRELATECARLLSDEPSKDKCEKESFEYQSVFEYFTKDRLDDLPVVCSGIIQHDASAIVELASRLNEPGRVTIHQFLITVLPALHEAFVGRSKGNKERHRNKKARVDDNNSEGSVADSRDTRLDFCRESLRTLVKEVDEKRKFPTRSFLIGSPDIDMRSEDSEDDDYEDGNGEKRQERKIEDLDADRKVDISYSAGASEILRRLHQLLSFHESVRVFSMSTEKSSSSNRSPKTSELQALTKPIELKLLPTGSSLSNSLVHVTQSMLQVEPLIPLADLELHIMRTYRITDPLYISYCQSLSSGRAIIVERPAKHGQYPWMIARVISFDESSGSHRVRYASGWKKGNERSFVRLDRTANAPLLFDFSGQESTLVLAARNFYVLHRDSSPVLCNQSLLSSSDHKEAIVRTESVADSFPSKLGGLIGSRVESNCGLDGAWNIYTLIGKDSNLRGNSDDERFLLVSDEGELFSGITPEQIRLDDVRTDDTSRPLRAGGGGLFPFFTSRQRSDTESSCAGPSKTKALKRTWSALSLIDDMQPVDLKLTDKQAHFPFSNNPGDLNLSCSLEGKHFHFSIDSSVFEFPLRAYVMFSAKEKLPSVDLSAGNDKTFIAALKDIYQKQEKWNGWPPKQTCKLFFSVKVEQKDEHKLLAEKRPVPSKHKLETDFEAKSSISWSGRQEDRSRKLSSRSLASDEFDDESIPLCEGVDEVCVKCMEVINVLSDCAEDGSVSGNKDGPELPGFSNASLSKKLSEQLDDSMCVVGGALPDWCLLAPAFAPRVFTYDSRRLLLERAAFGPSRSTLKQQEAKVNVGRLRQRMASLRSRAVELVGEAFSGGAEDPTALQLQADELYGMEEALASRVRAAFRAVKWQEHSLEVAKAAVRRENLLQDAAAVMDNYANDSSISRRRLEVRFEGESGFDAASGDEAGVTRGFYADVAEALLSADNVAGVCCSSSCSNVAVAAVATASSLKMTQSLNTDEMEVEAKKLPLWIPDFDTTAQVVIPTPRADKRSGPGVFPRPVPHYHPQHEDVLQKFSFMGRLFAAAMRDGFMFPLPLSSSFLKLVLRVAESSTQSSNGNYTNPHDLILTSGDLPRPGFIGGEVYAADKHICRLLDSLDSADPPLSRHELKRRYEEIAADRNFARIAFGKTYELSFEEYFQDRTFVDPLDPTQGEDAVPLCHKGHLKPVTIYNIREWVAMAKAFLLQDGVIAQAIAFRRGVEDFFSIEYLRLFTSEELQRDVCGVGDDVDNWDESAIRKLFKLDGGKGAAEALVAVAAIGGEGGAALSRRFGPSSPTIAFLVKALLEATPKQRRQFLSFVTSVPIVTPGRIEVVPILSPSGDFLPMQDPACLPRANTCSRRLYLPKFDCFESFSQVLWAVVREESKFKGFYEWRGS